MKLNYNETAAGFSNFIPRLLNSSMHAMRFKQKAMLALASLCALTSVQSFAQDSYCIPNTSYVDGQGITNVSIGSINNTTGLEPEGNYGDFTAQTVNLGRAATYPINVTVTTSISYSLKVWVDWNNNFIFENSEQILTSVSEEVASFTASGTFIIPAAASLGNHRMRVATRAAYSGLAQPCYGENDFDAAAYEDYTVNVTATPTCFIPGTPVIANTGNGTINVNWTAPATGNPVGYEYAFATTNTPPASGTAVTATSLTNLTVPTNIRNYFFIRSNCGNSNYSEWVTGTFYNGVCVPTPELSLGTGITNVTIGTINNETLDEDGYYGDYSAQTATVGQGVTQPFSITVTDSATHYIGMWVDWNNDLDFDDEGEKVFEGVSSDRNLDILRGTFTVPLNAALGNHRLRVGAALTFGQSINPCNQSIGTFEDYTLNVTTPPSCYTPLSPVGVTVAAGTANISWTAPTLGGTPVGYEYAVTTSATPPASGTANTTTTANGVTVTYNTTNYIHVRTNCGNGDYSEWMTASYYNGYCIPNTLYRDGNGITNVTIGAVNNTTQAEENNYGDYTAQIATIGQGVNKPFSISLNTDGLRYIAKIWVDWNNDLDFDDEGEEMYTGTTTNAPNTILRGYISVPLTTTLGNHRMRIGTMPLNNGIPVPCSDNNYGVFEDYTLNITTAPGCYTPDNFTAVNETAGFATLTWDAPSLGGTPAGYEYAVTATAAAPQNGTATTATTLTAIAVTPYVTNYLHVRTNCGNADFSEWITIELYNGFCIPSPSSVENDGIINVTIGSINNITEAEEGQYGDYTAFVANIGQGVTQQFRLSISANSLHNIKMWVDFNNNLIFEESEEIYSGSTIPSSTDPLSGTFTIPATAPLGNHRLRIAAASEFAGDVTPCDIRNSASYEDYTINVTTPPSCFTPLSPTGVGTASLNANLSWQAPAQGNPADYEYAVTTSTTPPASGTPVTGTTVTGYQLEADNTYYYLHVRTKCGENDFSQWVISERFRFLPGDICSTAINLSTLNSPYSFTTEGAGNDYNPTCGFGQASDIFYSIEVPNGYSLNIGLTSTNYDFVSSVFYGGCTTASQTVVSCIDTFGEERFVTWENLTGQSQTVYWVQDGYETYFGNYTLEWSLTEPAACDRPRELSAVLTSLTSADISWTAPNTGTPVGYEYAITTSETPPANGQNTTELSVNGVTFTYGEENYLHVRAFCGENSNSIWVTYAFYGGYCLPVNTESEDLYITGITTLGGQTNITNTSTGFNAYTDYSAEHVVSTYAGGSFAVTATHPGAECYYAIWIDWNNDLEFSANERVANSGNLASPATIDNIAVPAGTAQGNYRMRIRNTRGTIPTACGETISGEAEDYTLTVGPTPTCFAPYALNIIPVDETSADLSWSAPILGTLPLGYEYVVSTSATPPANGGTFTTSTYIFGEAYNSAVNNYLYVRSSCGDGDYSSWETFTILDTNTPELVKNNIVVYKEGSAINISAGNTMITGVTVYDIRGSRLYTQNSINATQATITGMQVQQQVLIIEVTTAKGKASKRIVY